MGCLILCDRQSPTGFRAKRIGGGDLTGRPQDEVTQVTEDEVRPQIGQLALTGRSRNVPGELTPSGSDYSGSSKVMPSADSRDRTESSRKLPGEPDAVPGRESVPDAVQLERHLLGRPRLPRHRPVPPVPRRQLSAPRGPASTNRPAPHRGAGPALCDPARPATREARSSTARAEPRPGPPGSSARRAGPARGRHRLLRSAERPARPGIHVCFRGSRKISVLFR